VGGEPEDALLVPANERAEGVRVTFARGLHQLTVRSMSHTGQTARADAGRSRHEKIVQHH
jgi:hypothetical protein